MLGREIEEELVVEKQAAALPTVTLNEGIGVLGMYVDDDSTEDVDEGTSDRDDIMNDRGMSSGTKRKTLTKREGEFSEHDEEVARKRVVDDGGSDKNEGSKENRDSILED
ncbi:hypothetical protein AHAS_Ahas03G0304300 [Arachis hypogaea]